MSYIDHKIKEVFPDIAVMKKSENKSLFTGRNLPSFVKDFILRKYLNSEGIVDSGKVVTYLESKMPNPDSLKARLLAGEEVNITTRFIIKTDLSIGKTTFSIPDAQLTKDAYLSSTLLAEKREDLIDGEHWGNITLEYVVPQGNKKGFVQMVSFKSFNPYKISPDYYKDARQHFTLEEWMDILISTMEYNPESFISEEQKLEFISRLLVFVEPQLNVIELGPKGTGKSYIFNNLSKYAWIISGGKTSRAKLFYNKSTKQYGIMKYHDVVAFDEISTFGFTDPDEMQSILKSYLEAGKASVDNVMFQADCGLLLMGNIPLSGDMQPRSKEYFRTLPEMFHESATIDRFHSFIEGWKLPRLSSGSVLEGWAINAEYFSEILHHLRTDVSYEGIFNKIVTYSSSCDMRDLNAVRKVATAYAKLLFPHIVDIDALEPQELEEYKQLYNNYCLTPAIYRRGIIRSQCHLIDEEFKIEMPDFHMKETPIDDEI